jgi:Domain of unknown function (DUF4177)
MKPKLNLILCIVGLLVFLAWSINGQVNQSKGRSAAWEYKIITLVTEEKLNELGAQGWEVVTVTPAVPTGSSTGASICYLKRAR